MGMVSVLIIPTEHAVSMTTKRYLYGVGGMVDVNTGELNTRPI